MIVWVVVALSRVVSCPSRRATVLSACRTGRRSAQGAPASGPQLAALLAGAVADLGRLDDGQLLGAGSAARRLAAHAGYLEMMAVAEFARRRQDQLEASRARGDKVRSRDGEYAAEELGFEMTASAYSAAVLMHGAERGRPAAVHAGRDGGGRD